MRSSDRVRGKVRAASSYQLRPSKSTHLRSSIVQPLYSPVEIFHIIQYRAGGCSKAATLMHLADDNRGQLKEDLRFDRLFTSWHK